jgi:hypothetical protein
VGGVGGATSIDCWCVLDVELRGVTVSLICAVVDMLGNTLILGQPFLQEGRVVPFFREGFMKSKWGPLPLLYGRRKALTAYLRLKELSDQDWAKFQKAIGKTNLSKANEGKLKQLVLEFADLWTGERRGVAKTIKHEIHLDTNRPIVDRPRHHPPKYMQIAEREVADMLKEGVIRHSKSPYASEIVLVNKAADKGGGIRVCIDYRRLNQHTIPDRHPLPRLQDLVRNIRQSRYFVALDLRAGYWQIPLAEEAIPKTAFRCGRSLYEFLVMPFGLTNAPATFQRAMESIFGDLAWSGVCVYLDDILVHAETELQLLERVRLVFDRLREHNLTVKLEKCSFGPPEIEYLGYIVGGGCLKPNLRKVQALKRWRVPRCQTELRALLGFLGFYRQFIPHYSTLTAELTDMTKKHARVKWRRRHSRVVKAIFQHLQRITLHNPLETDYLQVETDASEVGVAAALSCRSKGGAWKPVAFATHKFAPRESGWPSYEREAYGILFACEKFDAFVRGREFRVITDCESLQWMQSAKGKVGRWASRLAEYRMSIVHRSGKKIPHVDFLSRYVFPEVS